MRNYAIICLLFIGIHYQSAAQTVIKSDDPHIHYMGRIDKKDDASVLSWPGTSLTINFTGTGVKAVMQDERAQNYYNVIVDGKVTGKLILDRPKKEYTLVEGLPNGKHTLELFKRTEWTMGKTLFYQFTLNDGGKILNAPATKKHKIAYFGDSITCGYAIEDSTGKDRGTAPFEDNYLSYAAITARHFNAEYSCVARSGIGVLISWFPQTMPEMYDRLDGNDPKNLWDFSKYTPDVVVVNLFQNDAWLVKQPEHAQFKARFGTTAPTDEQIISTYATFIKNLRSKYPKAQIICALGSMDATQTDQWPGYIKKAAARLADNKIYTCIFPYKGTPGHPNIQTHQDMADQLISFIDKNIKW